jgi:proline iminopeptidase
VKIRTLSLLIPFAAAACDQAPTLSSSSAPVAPFAISYEAPVTSEGFLTGAGGMQLFYRVYGSGKDTTVVLGGGPALPISYFDKDLAPLAHGRTLIFFDARGAGKSQLTTNPALLTMGHHVADLEAVRAHFGLDEMKLVGHSWGAMLAAHYAAEYPQHVNRMVLVTPGPVQAKYDAEHDAIRVSRTDPKVLERQGELFGLLLGGASTQPVKDCTELFDSFFPAYFHDPANVANVHGTWCPQTDDAAALLLMGMFAGRGSLGPNWNLVPMLEGIQTPALVIHGTGDPIPAASTVAYADALPNGTLRIIQGAGHFPWAEEPAAFFSAVNTFLRRGNL